jgi:DNA-binding NtrC family response regulator
MVVGIAERSRDIQGLPLRILTMETGFEAIQCLKKERIAAVASRWELCDMPDGRFLTRLLAMRPGFPTIAFVEDGNPQQEIAARHAGVVAVLPNSTDSDYFRQIVCQILGFKFVCGIQKLDKDMTQHLN